MSKVNTGVSRNNSRIVQIDGSIATPEILNGGLKINESTDATEKTISWDDTAKKYKYHDGTDWVFFGGDGGDDLGGGGDNEPPISTVAGLGYPAPLALWRMDGDGNSGAVNPNGGQNAGDYDLTATAPGQFVLGGGRWGQAYYYPTPAAASGWTYSGANLAALKLTGAMTALARVRIDARSAADNVILAFRDNTGVQPGRNAQYSLVIRGSGSGSANIYYLHEYDATLTFLLSPVDFELGVDIVVGFARKADGQTVRMFCNGGQLGAETVLAAPPNGGTTAALGVFGSYPVSARSCAGLLSSVAIWDTELTNDQVQAATEAMQ